MSQTKPSNYSGERYPARVPDTLDLADRAGMAAHHLTSIIDEENDGAMFWTGGYTPRGMYHWSLGWPVCQCKAVEALPMLRVMSGSRENIELESRMMGMWASLFGEDGIYWVPKMEGRMPWLGPEEMRPYAHIGAQGRALYAVIQWYQYTGDPAWKERGDRMVQALDRILAVHKDDYAYFPTRGWIEEEYFRSCYVKERGWKDTSEPEDEKGGEEGSLFNPQGFIPGALANWHLLTGNQDALRLSGELVRFYTKPRFWADWKGGEYSGVIGAEHAHWDGHFHGHMTTLRAILEYAIATNDSRLKSFVREGYEWARQVTLTRFGFVGDCQGCGCGRLIGLAVKLSKAGVGDYWEDVDTYIRNIGTEMQFTPEDFPDIYDGDKVRLPSSALDFRQVMIGGFALSPEKTDWALCCSPHGAMGLFYAWDGTLQHSDGAAQVNLLLNRASPWMDIESYLPYEGKVVLRNKACREAFVRIPLWVEQGSVSCRVGDRAARPGWLGRTLRLEHLKEGDVVTIEFPVEERVEHWTGPASETFKSDSVVTCGPQPAASAPMAFRLKGNTIIGISQPILPGSPLFQSRAEKYRSAEAPMRDVERFAAPLALKW